MGVYDLGEIEGIDGRPIELARLKGEATLVVNVASKCGLTPQYAALQRLHVRFAQRGFTVLAVPCNQFGEQEPGSEEEIEEFCSSNYGVSFPITAKTDVNGRKRHPLYDQLTQHPDAAGRAGDVDWNFEKFLVSPDGEVVARYRPRTDPESDEIVSAIEATLSA
jgi:glutathione peroxidase